MDDNQEIHVTIWEHLYELRNTLIAVLTIILLGTCLCFVFYQPLLKFFGSPLQNLGHNLQIEELSFKRIKNLGSTPFEYPLPQGIDIKQLNTITIPPGGEIEVAIPIKNASLVLLSPLEGITTTLKICFWTGLVVSSPLWMLFILRFITPALHTPIKRVIIPFLFLSLIFFAGGFLFAYWITLPIANDYLYAFNLEIGKNLWSLAQYFDYTILILFANGLAAEFSLILFFLVHFRVFDSEVLIAKRRHAVVAAFILGAILTPPDVLTQLMLAIPLIIFYEIAILYARYRSEAQTAPKEALFSVIPKEYGTTRAQKDFNDKQQ